MSYFPSVLKRAMWRGLMLVVLLATACSTGAQSSYGPWKSAPIRGGGYLQQVFFAPSDPKRMYVTSDVGGVFRSDDGGRHWKMLHGALPADAGSYSPRGFLVHPQDANRIWVATGSPWGQVNGVFVSRDGGASWKQTLRARFEGNGSYRSAGNVLAMASDNPDLMLAGPLGGGLARSENGGESWTRVGPDDINPVAILFDRTDSRRVWVCARPWGEVKYKRANGQEVPLRGGLFFSEDSGQTWTQITVDSPTEIIQDPRDPQLLWGATRKNQIVASRDGGKSWTEQNEGLAPKGDGDARKDGTYEALAAGPDFIVVGGQGGHFYRRGVGESKWTPVKWDKVDEGDWWGRMRRGSVQHFGSALGFVGIDPRDPNHWVFTDWYALYQSHDAGKKWELTIDGIEMTVLNTLAQEPTSPTTFHAGMADVGYFRSSDAGATMQQVTSGISNNIKTIAVSPTQPGRVYATGPQRWEWQANELFISDDAGLNWRRSGLQSIPDMENRRCETVAVSPSRPDEVWVTVSGTVKPNEGGPWRSLDGGQSWSWQGQGLPEGNGFFHKDFWVAGPELAVSGDGSLLCSSDDRHLLARRGPNEENWTMLPLPDGAPNCVAADPLVPGRFYLALQGGGLWRSDDGGVKWTNIVNRDVNWVTPDFKTKNRVAAVTSSGGVLVSSDGGESWHEMSRALPYRHGRNVVAFVGEQIAVGTGGNGAFVAPLASLQGDALRLARAGSTVPDQAQDATPLPVAITLNDRAVRVVGRFDTSDPNSWRCAWPASSIEVRFEGTALGARLSGGQNVRWQVEVDGRPTQKLNVGEGEKLYRLADHLTPGEHTVRLVQATEALFGTTHIFGFQLNEGGRALPVTVPRRRLEVIGDSISAGYGNEAKGKDEHFSPNTENAYFTYGAIAARALKADYSCLAWSGKKMWPDNTLPALYDFALPVEKTAWDFSRATAPDAVVINLATNDFAAGVPEEKGWTEGYKAFVARVRKNYPNAQIYCAIGPMMGDWGPGNKPLTTLRGYLARLVQQINAEGDAKVKVLDFGTQDGNLGFGADWHPNIANHERMAAQLVRTLRDDLGWKPD